MEVDSDGKFSWRARDSMAIIDSSHNKTRYGTRLLAVSSISPSGGTKVKSCFSSPEQ